MTTATAALATLGWRVDTPAQAAQATRDYQRAWALGPALTVDGQPGPKTMAALETSLRRRAAGLGDLSANMSARDFACKCAGRYPDCRRIWPHRALVAGAQAYRDRLLGAPFTPVSACRCPRHNAAVGGYTRSQHLHGLAMDVPARYAAADVAALRVFHALGINRPHNTVRHVDLRALGPDNHPRATGSTAKPYLYVYPGTSTARPVKPTPTQPIEEDDMPYTPAQLKALIREAVRTELRSAEGTETLRQLTTGRRLYRNPADPNGQRIPLGQLNEIAAAAALKAAGEEPS